MTTPAYTKFIFHCTLLKRYFLCKHLLLPISITVSVSDPPSTAVTHTGLWKATEGNSVTLTCDVTDGNPGGYIKPVTWKKGDVVLHSSSHHQLSDKVLEISSLNHTVDDGNYSCAAQNEAGMGDFSAKFHLLVNCKCELILCQFYKLTIRLFSGHML